MSKRRTIRRTICGVSFRLPLSEVKNADKFISPELKENWMLNAIHQNLNETEDSNYAFENVSSLFVFKH